MQHWLLKSEPSVYPFAQLVKDGRTEWTGIRSFEARNNLRAMKKGDLAFFYHSNDGKEIVGVARVLAEAMADSTAPGEDWASVEVAPVAPLRAPVTLAEIKKNAALKELALVRKSRLSVLPVTPAEFKTLLKMSGTPASALTADQD